MKKLIFAIISVALVVACQKAPSIVSVSGVTLNKTSLTLTEGGSETLVATVNPSNATDTSVSWSSSDATVASVDVSGKVTALKAGTATITVTTTDGGKTASCAVTVNANSTGIDIGIKDPAFGEVDL